MKLEDYFAQFRKNIIGIDSTLAGRKGDVPLVYADWIASGRLYSEIENRITHEIGPMVANTHSEASTTGKAMTLAYHKAQKIIKQHVNANDGDVIINAGSGMTAVINKLQRILGLRIPENVIDLRHGLPSHKKGQKNSAVVFISHMEHHSNHISWLETIAEVVVIEPDENLQVDPAALERALEGYSDRTLKIGSFSAASNVTGFVPPYRELSRIMHKHKGFAFIDFAAAAPYVQIDMHPEGDELGYLDGIFFSPHKFLGGPGSAGTLVFNSKLYRNSIPDNPGGGTVNWTNRWGERSYITDIEAREDGGTPPFLQTIRTALAIQLKEAMGCEKIQAREEELLDLAVPKLREISGLHFLGDEMGLPMKRQLGILSFYIDGIHHNLIVALLNDLFGIQVRGGCSCAGTYGHWLLHVSREDSNRITSDIDQGNLRDKPGWVRISLHPTMTDSELEYIITSIREIVHNIETLAEDYIFNTKTGEFELMGNSTAFNPPTHWFRDF